MLTCLLTRAAGVVNPMRMWACAEAALVSTYLGCRCRASAVAAAGETLLPLTCTFTDTRLPADTFPAGRRGSSA